MKKIAIVLYSAVFSLGLQAQFHVCGTDFYRQQLKQSNPQFAIDEEVANQQSLIQINNNEQHNKKAGVIIIPVVFHVIHQNGVENITQAQIMDQLRVLNEDFRKKSGTNGAASTNPLAIDMEYEFRLAQIDPNGKRHDGINRISSSLTNDARNNVKALSYWPSNRYLNIWVVKTIDNISGSGEGTVLGFAQFPSDINNSPTTDGIVIRADYVGVIQTGNGNNAGRTLTHEVGHWIGLYHTFQNGCVGANSGTCSSQGDRVCDTPPVADATFGCLTSRNSCTNDVPENPDLITNYMDYMDGRCANVYTPGQKARSIALMQIYRTNIYSASNLLAAGINADGSYINIPASPIKVPYSYGFEDNNISTAGWTIQNLNNGSNAWKSDPVAHSGNKSLGFRNFNITAVLNSRDEFFSPLLDLSTLANPMLSFKVAYARKATSSNDIFDVGVSGDFGRTEVRVYRGTASNLESVPNVVSTEFIPSSQSEWRTINIDLTPFRGYNNVRIRFEFSNRRGNNIFVDDFAVVQLTGVAENLKNQVGFTVSPNPMNDNTSASFNLNQSQNINIYLTDLLGRKIKTIQSGLLNSGMHTFSISKADIKAGIYLIQFETTNGSFAHKLVVN